MGEGKLERLITVTNSKDSQEILSAKGWVWVGHGVDSRKTSQYGFQLPLPINQIPKLGLWITKKPLCKHCLITFHVIWAVQGSSAWISCKLYVTQEPLCWHTHLSAISSKQQLTGFIFLPAATENVGHSIDSSWKADTCIPNKILEIVSPWCSFHWHDFILGLLVRSWTQC